MPPMRGHANTDHNHATATGPGHKTLERVTVNLTPRACNALEAIVQRTGDSKTDTINRALQIYNYLDEIMHSGGAVYVQDHNGKPERLKIF
jgi:hypothetical protein